MGIILDHIKRMLLCLTVMLCSTGGYALHIKGGWMSYRYIGVDGVGNRQYEITVKVFRDCGIQSPGQNDNVIYISVFRNSNNTSAGPAFAAGLVQNYTLRKNSFSPCISPPPDVCYVILEYRGNVSLPPTDQGYTLSFQRCCRINGIVNVQQPSNNLGNTYTIQLPGSALGTRNLENSSPIFAENDTAVVCFNNTLTLDYSAVDPDGDSLVYEFAPALSGASSGNPAPSTSTPPPFASISYPEGFSAENPFGTSMTLNSQTGIITGITPRTTGEYVVAVIVKEYRNGQLIASTRKELHVNVANCTTPDADLPAERINCDNFEMTFENSSFSPVINSYYWDMGAPGQPGNITDLIRPTFVYPDTGTYVAKLVVNRGQACSDSTTMLVKIYPGFNPGFTVDGSCFSNPFIFRDTTRAIFGSPNSWRWDFGNPNADNDTSRLRNPSYTFPSTGTFNVSLKATSNKGCDKTVVIPVEVFDKPALKLPFKDTLICSVDTLQLIAQGTGNFSWTTSSNRILDANTATPRVFPLTSTSYFVSLNDRGCIAKDTIRVNVLDFISVDAGRDTTICLGDTIFLRPITAGLSFRWTPENTLNNPNIRNPLAFPNAASTSYIITANLGKCQDTDTVEVRTVPYPIALASPDTSICFGSTISLAGVQNGTRIQWLDPVNLPLTNNPTITVTPPESSTYTFLVYDDAGCPKPGVARVFVNVIPKIIVDAGRDTSIVFGQQLILNSSSNAVFNRWFPATGLNTSSGLNPILRLSRDSLPLGTDFVTYRLIGTTPEGCTGEDEVTIRVFSTGPSIFVPTAFTPNGDGLNDNIRPILAGVQQFDFFRIFNRYGQLVFEAKQPELSWDGRLKGQPQGSGTFVYQVQAVDYTGELLTQKGTFILIR